MPAAPLAPQIASPWADNSHLGRVLVGELWPGADAGDLAGLSRISRAEAMTVPAVAAARNRIVGTLSRLPLIATGTDGSPWTRALNLVTQPDEAEQHNATMARTLDDILFRGRAWWAVVTVYREAAGDRLFPRSIVQLPDEHVDDAGMPSEAFTTWLREHRKLEIMPRSATDRRPWLLYFAGPHEGLCNFGGPSIRAAAAMERAAGRAADNPVPSIELHQTTTAPMTPEAKRELVQGWVDARRGRNGGVAFTNAAVDVRTHGVADAQLLVDARNQSAVDVARLAGIPASSIDAGLPGASITYANLTERMADLVNMGLQPYAAAVTARLSMDDVLPQGVRVRFDYSELYPATPTAATSSTPTPTPAPAGADQ